MMSASTPASNPDSDPPKPRDSEQTPHAAPSAPPLAAFQSPAFGSVIRRRRKRRKPIPYLGIVLGLCLLVLVGVALGIGFGYLLHNRTAHKAREGMLTGFIFDASLVDQEYLRYYGKASESRVPLGQFERAVGLARQRSFAEAADLLESVSRQAAVPAVFNNLGVLYAELNDWQRAESAFREALARNPQYPPVLANLGRLNGFSSDVSAPLTREVEPNNTRFAANLVTVGTPVEGEITAGIGDIDFFRFSFPSSPSDVLEVDLANHDYRLIPRLDVYDSQMQVLDWGRKTAEPGRSLAIYGSAPPNSTIYLAVSGAESSSGKYVLTLRSMKAYDEFEPNDDILHAHKMEQQTVAHGKLEYAPIRANILDRDDTDYYSFLAPCTCKITVDVHNESVTLIPAVQFYGPDMRSMGFGPTLHNPGESLQTSFDIQKGRTYYIQVWSERNSSGWYSLTVH